LQASIAVGKISTVLDKAGEKMGVSPEIVQNLRILGLPSDATADDVRSAFRRLAKIYHPDVAGKQYTRKFERISNAYAALKDLPLGEFFHADAGIAESTQDASVFKNDIPGFRLIFRNALEKPFAWYRKRQERIGAEKERSRRAVEDAKKRILLKEETRIDAILNRGERLLGDLLNRRERELRRVGIQGLALRLSSSRCQIRHMALAHVGELVNKTEVFEALLKSLQKWDIDDKTARIVASLPLEPEKHRKLAYSLASRPMPDLLLSNLLHSHNPADRELMELYLNHAGARGITSILRRWPQGAFVSEATLCRLISHEDESVLIAVLSAMKQRSIPCPLGELKQLDAYLSHPNIGVRVWAKALLAESAGQSGL